MSELEPQPNRIITAYVEAEQEEYPPLPQELVDMMEAYIRGLPNPHPELGELVPLDPKADPVRMPIRSLDRGVSPIRTVRVDRGIRTVTTPQIRTVRPDTSGITTVKPEGPDIQTIPTPPIRTVRPE